MTRLSEAETRKRLIDTALDHAGWDVGDQHRVGLEIPVDLSEPTAWQRLKRRLDLAREDHAPYVVEPTAIPPGICDYALYRDNGDIIAIVEAKKASYDARYAQAQAEFYVDEIGRRQSLAPFAFLSNGEKTYFLEPGSNKREVAGFFGGEDLANRLYLRENAAPLAAQPINAAIIDRPYQHEAVRRVAEAFAAGKRKTLLVMATGTGKTRVSMALVDLFLSANQARRILFVADRDPLVRQALTDGFQRHLPHEPATRIRGGRFDATKRLYVVTLQRLARCYQDISPGFFDLIIFDEVHRSIFNLWHDPLHYFDARMVGLTATPANLIDRNTFTAFDCHDDVPTFLYDYKQAIRDKYLVDFSLYQAQTGFQRTGIHGGRLSDEDRQQLMGQGLDPDEISYSGTELERTVSNKDTLRRQWQEIMDVAYWDGSGQRPAKTIVFAMTQAHAQRLQDVFEAMYPQFPGLVRVITEATNYRDTLIDDFKKADQPRIAITVDLLETGVDVPEVCNLVFMKPVHSGIKLWQMIGRGTRSHAACHYPERLPNGHKDAFLILDFWENDFNKAPDAGAVSQGLPVLVSLFNTRLKLLERHLADQRGAEFERVVADLRAAIARVPLDAYAVRQALPEARVAWDADFWRLLTRAKLDFLRLKVAPLLRYTPNVDEAAATFASKVERLKLRILSGQDAAADALQVAEDVARLPDTLLTPAQRQVRDAALSPALSQATVAELDTLIDSLGPQMRNRSERENLLVSLDLKDLIAERGPILLYGGSQPVYVDQYKKLVEQRILDLISSDPTLQAVSAGQAVSDEQLLALERTLHRDLGAPGIELNEANLRLAYGRRVPSLLDFVRELLGLDGLPGYEAIVRRRFDAFSASQPFTADQIRFLRAAQSVFLERRQLREADLYEEPFTRFGQDAVERLFTAQQVGEMLRLAEELVA